MYICDTYIVSGDSASRVARDELELHVNFCKEVLVNGAEAGTGELVEGEGEEAAAVEDFATAVAPCDLEVLVEVAGGGSHNEDAKYEKTNGNEVGHIQENLMVVDGKKINIYICRKRN